MAERFRLALIQTDSTGTVGENRTAIEKFIKAAKESGARLVILPEHADVIGDDIEKHAGETAAHAEEYYASLAAKYSLYLHLGSYAEENDTGRPYNTTVLFGPAGNKIASYRKLHMFDVDVDGGVTINESDTVSPGDHISLVKTPLCNMGLSICYDLRFPELYRLLALGGAELLIVSANFTSKTGEAHWTSLLRARAIENACYVAAVDQCGRNRNFRAYGHTMWIDPWGRIIGELEQTPGLLMAEFDPEEVIKARKQIPVLSNRRGDIYDLSSVHLRIYEG